MQTVRVILAEDDDDDFFFAERAFLKASNRVSVERARDGEETLAILERNDAAVPSLILLDVKMPRLSGLQVLEAIRGMDGFATVPILMLSSSAEPQDVRRAYELRATSYFVKPTTSSELDELVGVIVKYWLRYCLTPSSPMLEGAERGNL